MFKSKKENDRELLTGIDPYEPITDESEYMPFLVVIVLIAFAVAASIISIFERNCK